MKPLDPYEELGVGKDATEADVKAAYRGRAKALHPDRNPDDPQATEKFTRATTAMTVLIDPIRRKRFDETGAVEDDKPDNMRAGAVQLIEAFVEKVVADYINGGFKPADDPRRMDLVEEFRDQMNNDLGNAEVALLSWAKAKVFLTDMAKRFKTDKPNGVIERAFQNRLRRAEDQVRQLKEASEMRRVALTIISDYEFEFDRPSTPGDNQFGRWTVAGGGWAGGGGAV